MWRVWDALDPDAGLAQGQHGHAYPERPLELLAQIHDALLAQVLSDRIEVLHQMRNLMQIPIPVTDIYGTTRTMTIEAEFAIGANWGKRDDKNPQGMWEPPEYNS